MCFPGFPTETFDEALETLRFLDERRDQVAAFLVGELDTAPTRWSRKRPRVSASGRSGRPRGHPRDGTLLRRDVPPKRDDEPDRLDRALDDLCAGWLLRRYPWAGSLSTAHTVLYYDRYGRDVFRRVGRERALRPMPGRYRTIAGEGPVAVGSRARGRRPSKSPNALA